MTEHPSLTKPKPSDAEVQKVAEEFLSPFQQIVETRRRLQETEEELRGLVTALSQKIDAFSELKQQNLQLEREVLLKLNAELNL
jgi:hypothetical protein